MTIQKMKHNYQDGHMTVEFEAEQREDEWANHADLRHAIDAVIKCADNWKTFKLHITTNGYTND